MNKIFSKKTHNVDDFTLNYLDNEEIIYYTEKFTYKFGFCVTNKQLENRFFFLQ